MNVELALGLMMETRVFLLIFRNFVWTDRHIVFCRRSANVLIGGVAGSFVSLQIKR